MWPHHYDSTCSVRTTVHFKWVVMRNREKLKYTSIELQDAVPIHSIMASRIVKLFSIPHDNQPEIHPNYMALQTWLCFMWSLKRRSKNALCN